MLSREEKKEMLEDAKNNARRQHFRIKKERNAYADSLDEYISFLSSVQRIFSPFTSCNHPTQTKFNKL